MTRVSVGLLAHNEERRIDKTLRSLARQSLFASRYHCELVIVPNGCTDGTVATTRAALRSFPEGALRAARVEELAEPGKSNAWNRFVHELSRPDAEYLILMDADIDFLQDSTLESLVTALVETPSAWVATDVPVKDVSVMQRRSWLQAAVAKVGGKPPADAICGQLYCGRASVLRQVTMPAGLPVEDGFLRAMVDTHFFTERESRAAERICVAPDASHVFEAFETLPQLLRHETRIVVGTAMNACIFSYFWAHCGGEKSVKELVEESNRRDPEWVQHLLRQRAQQTRWVVPPSFLRRRFRALRARGPLARALPVALALTSIDLLVYLRANRVLRAAGGVGYW